MDKNISQIVMSKNDSEHTDSLEVYLSKPLHYNEKDFDKRLEIICIKDVFLLLLFGATTISFLVFGISLAVKIGELFIPVTLILLVSTFCFFNSVSVKLNDKMFAIEEEKERLEKTEVSTISLNEEHLKFINSQGEHFVYNVNIVLTSASSQKQQADKILKALADIEELAPQSDKNKTDATKLEILELLASVLNSYDKDFKEKQLIKEEDAETFAANDFIIENLAKETKIELGF